MDDSWTAQQTADAIQKYTKHKDCVVEWIKTKNIAPIICLLEENIIDTNTILTDNYTLLVSAAKENQLSLCKILIDKFNADVNDSSGFEGNCALGWAVINQNNDLCKMLIDKGADVNYRNINGLSALHLAASKKYTTCKLLIAAGANVNNKTNRGSTPLMNAAYNGHDQICKILLDHGANINDCNNDGFSPLMVAASENHYTTCKLLIDAGANVNDKKNDAWTALIISAFRGHYDICKLLISVNPKSLLCKTLDNATAIDAAVQEEHDNVTRLLADEYIKIKHELSVQETSNFLAAVTNITYQPLKLQILQEFSNF